MPFEGVTSIDSKDFYFDYASPKFIVAICLKFFGAIEFVLVSYKILEDGFQFDDTLFFLLNGGGIYLGLYLIVLGSNWPEHMQFWAENEKVFTSSVYSGKKYFRKFQRKIILLTVFILGFTLCKI